MSMASCGRAELGAMGDLEEGKGRGGSRLSLGWGDPGPVCPEAKTRPLSTGIWNDSTLTS